MIFGGRGPIADAAGGTGGVDGVAAGGNVGLGSGRARALVAYEVLLGAASKQAMREEDCGKMMGGWSWVSGC